MRSALIENGIVTNVIIGEMAGYIPCGNDVGNGYLYDGAVFSAPPPPPEVLAEEQEKKCNNMKGAMMSQILEGLTTNGILMDCSLANASVFDLRYRHAVDKSSATMNITDYNNDTHLAVPIADALAMKLEIGDHLVALDDKWQAKRTYINDASRTIAEVQAVTWGSVE